MNGSWKALVIAANNVALTLPLAAVHQFTESLLLGPELPNTGTRHQIGDIWNSGFRQRCQEFLAIWRKEFPDLSKTAIVGALLASAHARSRLEQDRGIELVWTGPEVPDCPMRQTEQAVLELIDTAKDRLLIVCFAVYRIPRIRLSLVSAIARGVEVTLIIETPDRIEGEREYDTLRALGNQLLSDCMIYYWPKIKRPADAAGRTGLLHIKCIVQDGLTVFLSSANLTEYAFTTNMELGTIIRSQSVSSQIESHVSVLKDTGILERLLDL